MTSDNALPGDPPTKWIWSYLTSVAEAARYIRVVNLFASSDVGISGKIWDEFCLQRQAVLVGSFIGGFVLIISLVPFLYTPLS